MSDGWVSTTDRLPEANMQIGGAMVSDDVLVVYRAGGEVFTAVADYGDDGWWGQGVCALSDVIFWMPHPALPRCLE